MAFNIRKYLGLDGSPSVIPHSNNINAIPADLMDRIDKDINELISYVSGAKHAGPPKPPKTVKEHKESLNAFINETGLGSFFPPGNPLIAAIAEKAVEILNDPNAILNSPEQVATRAKVALYDVCLYCDDSYSMTFDQRIQAQKDFCSRLCNILLPFTTGGISLRFINDNGTYEGLNTPAEVQNVIQRVAYNQYTPIGTMLNTKILQPFYEKLQSKTLKKPLLIIIITDGWPYNEPDDLFKQNILNSYAEIKKNKKKELILKYQLNQIGDDPHATAFIKGIFEDPELTDRVYCTSEKLDEQISKLKGNEKGLNEWLYNTVFTKVVTPPTKPAKKG